MPAKHWVAAVVAVAAASVGATATSAASSPLSLGRTVRIVTPATSLCPAEGEPETTVTPRGTWVAYNDDHQCPLLPGSNRIEEVQFVPGQGAPHFIPLTPENGAVIAGDPDLAPAPDGGVYLSSLWQDSSGGGLKVLRISPDFHVSELPTPSLHSSGNSDDKEFIAVDLQRHSRWFGHLYIAWDDFVARATTLRAWNGRQWSKPVTIDTDIVAGDPDVAVGPGGVVAVVFTGNQGAVVRISRDGGRTFGPRIVALPGGSPGRWDAGCPLRPTIGVRQRAMMGPRVAFDRNGDLHVVAAIGDYSGLPTASTVTPASPAVVEHALLRGGAVVHREAITAPTSDEQWASALAPLPHGGIAVSWLQTNGAAASTYDAWIATEARGARSFTTPQRLSTASSNFPAAMEAVGNSDCYGIGDYIGMATTRDGVETVWPTTDTDIPGIDSDVLLRFATSP